ncbi:uncharacterized protein LOC131666783 isoform X2 [Phymastichus coffea]|uniref:uncharacterized protein LOC131666783 isoform X2 n=1 Tax=Phymastichus coffea TaxID=108790 RepID=UPI00273BA27C|nr:uncharacterized protein LOC131666783 isoform X2 [Phymastichus coffea]
MPRLKEGETPKSNRHIRRLVKRSTDSELKEILKNTFKTDNESATFSKSLQDSILSESALLEQDSAIQREPLSQSANEVSTSTDILSSSLELQELPVLDTGSIDQAINNEPNLQFTNPFLDFNKDIGRAILVIIVVVNVLLKMYKNYAIVIDDQNEKLVVPYKWLNKEKTTMYWPTGQKDVTKLIINNVNVQKDWETLNIQYIRSSDTYTDAVSDMKLLGDKVDELTDPSDDNRVKRTRSDRHKKKLDDSSDENSPPSKQLRIDYATDIVDGNSNINKSFTNTSKNNLIVPATINITNSVKDTSTSSSNKPSTSRVTVSMSVNDVEDTENYISLSERQLLLLSLANQKKIMTKLNNFNARINQLQSNVNISGASRETQHSLSEKHLQIIAKYFPIDEETKLLATVEEKLNNHSFYTLVYSSIKNVGGTSPKAHLDAMMKYLVTDKVLQEYSFTGQSKRANLQNKSFVSLQLYKVIFHCMKTLYGSEIITDKTINRYIANNLDTARTRIIRQEKKGVQNQTLPALSLSLLFDEDELGE